MLHIASIESFLGSLWFSGLALMMGYIAGQVFPISKLAALLTRSKS